MEESQKKELGQRIKAIRIESGKNMREFGKIFLPEASDSIVSRWERGVSVPTPERLKKISEIGGVSVTYLLTGIPDNLDDFHKSFKNLSNTVLQKNNELMAEEFHRYLDFFLALNNEGKKELTKYAKYLATMEEYQAGNPDNITIEIAGIDRAKPKDIDYKNSKNIIKMIFLNNKIFPND